MAVIGNAGKIQIKRPFTKPAVIEYNNINFVQEYVDLTSTNTQFRTGDLVEVASTNNWPHASMATPGLVANYTIDGTLDRTTPYPPAIAALNPIPINQFFINVDQLNRCSFYRSRAQALAGELASRETLDSSGFGVTDFLEIRLVDEWVIEANLTAWSLSLDGEQVDQTGLGERFYDGVRSLIRGGGTLDFIVDNSVTELTTGTIISSDDFVAGSPTEVYRRGTSNLLKMLLSTQDEAEAEAEFWLTKDQGFCVDSVGRTLLAGDLYYQSNILLTSTVVNTRVNEVITGSASFVTVEDVVLREGVN